MPGTVSYNRTREIGVLTLDQPERRNALSEAMWQGILDHLAQAAQDPPRVLVLTGAAGHFSAGADLYPDNPLTGRIAPTVFQKDPHAGRQVIQWLKSVTHAVATFPVPTIAAVEGSCIGSGLELALACDMIVASRGSRFGLPEVRIGFIPDVGGTTRLTRRVGKGRAALLATSGRLITGEQAFQLGLVDLVAEEGRSMEATESLATDILKGGPEAVRLVLGIVRSIPDLDLAVGLDSETDAGVAAMLSGEVGQGVLAFQKKEPPPWVTR